MMIERIQTAAILWQGVIYTVPRPGRHHDVVRLMRLTHKLPFESIRDQGFVTSTGRFVDRHEACIIAKQAGQIITKTGPSHTLFSEDMW